MQELLPIKLGKINGEHMVINSHAHVKLGVARLEMDGTATIICEDAYSEKNTCAALRR